MPKILVGKEVSKRNVIEALALDMDVYPEEYQLKLETCLEYFSKNDCIYVMLQDDGKVVGYINFSPVVSSAYERILSGTIVDTELTPEEIVSYDKSGEYQAYFSSMLLKKEYRGKGYGTLLVNSLVDFLCGLTEKNIFFSRIVADAISDSGVRMCEKFGLKKLRNSNHGSEIYEMQLLPWTCDVTPDNQKLYDLYVKGDVK